MKKHSNHGKSLWKSRIHRKKKHWKRWRNGTTKDFSVVRKGSGCCCQVTSVVSDSVRPQRWQPPGSAVPGILQARTLEWVAISFSNAGKWKVKVKSLSRVRLLATPWTAAHQAPPPSMGFSRQEYWSGAPLAFLCHHKNQLQGYCTLFREYGHRKAESLGGGLGRW